MSQIDRFNKVSNDLWAIRRVARVSDGQGGQRDIASRLTVVRLKNRGLFLHSPVALNADLEEELKRLGNVALIVAPSLWHHFFVKEYLAAYPEARALAAPGLREKRPDVAFHDTLDDDRALLGGEIENIVVRGHAANEVAFLHVPSRTLILADLAYNVREDSPASERNWFQRHEAYGDFALAKYHRERVTDPNAARSALRRVLEWDFDRVIVGHGQVLEGGGKQAFERIWSWLL